MPCGDLSLLRLLESWLDVAESGWEGFQCRPPLLVPEVRRFAETIFALLKYLSARFQLPQNEVPAVLPGLSEEKAYFGDKCLDKVVHFFAGCVKEISAYPPSIVPILEAGGSLEMAAAFAGQHDLKLDPARIMSVQCIHA